VNDADLPPGWAWATPEILASPERHSLGIGPFGSDLKVSDYCDGGVPLVFVRNIRSGNFGAARDKYVSPAKADALHAHRVQPGDLLITKMGAPPGDVCLYPQGVPDGVMTADCIRLRLNPDLPAPRFFLYGFRTEAVRDQILSRTGGVAQQKITLEKFRSVRAPVAPVHEAARIVAAIDQHFSDIDAGVAALERALLNLKRYRAAVLNAACEGRLVPTEAEIARKEGREYEPGLVLLQRILKERRARWEADQLAKMSAKGQVARDEQWKAKYDDTYKPDTNEVAVSPEGWTWATMDTLLATIQSGSSFKCDERRPESGEIGVVKVSAVTWGTYDEDESKTCLDASRIDPSLFVKAGDFLFSRANTIDLVGACVIAERVTAQIMLSDKILRFNLVGSQPRWVLYMLRSRQGRHDIERLSTGNQESMRNIGQDRIRQIRIPLPPLAEQRRIVAEIDRLLSVADTTEQAVRAQLARARRLRQAVLKRAFEGKLVPQDPSDESASVLLERLQNPGAEPAKPNTPPKRAAPRKARQRTEPLPDDRSDA
jgi:type I restriction enzyme S subunit